MTLREKIQHTIDFRKLHLLYNEKYETSICKLPSLFYWHCSRPMCHLKTYKTVKIFSFFSFKIKKIDDYICMNDNCSYHMRKP